MAGQVILAIAYGIDVRPDGDPYVAIAEKALHAVSLASSMGGGLFDLIPWRRPSTFNIFNQHAEYFTVINLPHWFPGASFKREGQYRLPHVNAMIDEPYAALQAALVRSIIS